MGKVDATENKELAQKYGVSGYPSLKFFVDGKAIDFTGGRTELEIVNWVERRLGEVSSKLTTKEDLQKFIDSANVVVIYYGDSEQDS